MRTVDTRGEEILSSLIAEFIQSGRAVGSATLAKRLGNRFSPALIRTVMSDLEKVGLLTHRHTSAGRLPTDEGMRYYVDQLLRVDQFSDEQIGEIKSRYRNTSYNVSSILKRTSEILSRVSNYAGLVVTPMMGEIVVRHMEFIPLSKSKVLGIFVGQDGVVENRMIRLGRDFNHAELEKINNYCNRAFYGLTLSEAALKVEIEIEEAQKNLDDLIHHALRLSEKLFLDMQSADLFVDGGSHLLQMPDFSDLDRSNTLMDVLEEKKQLIKLLSKMLKSDSLHIFIGSESGYQPIADCSVVARSYEKEGKVLGTLGVIGPTRMDYSKVIPIVDCTSRLISGFLNGEELYDE